MKVWNGLLKLGEGIREWLGIVGTVMDFLVQRRGTF